MTRDALQLIFRRKAGTARISLRLDKTGAVVATYPFFYPLRKVKQFVNAHADWIEKQRARLPPQRVFSDGQKITIAGREAVLVHAPTGRGTHIFGQALHVGGAPEFFHRRVCDFVKKETLAYIAPRAEEYAKALGVAHGRIALRDTSSRWGSCSGRKTLNFCWKIGLAPDYVIDYLVAHEVAHLCEMNHGDAFWATVARLPVRRADAEIWLRRHGRDLQAVK